ncbi:MAG: hypothetical protein DI626_04560 [Micavibrio aeruginosavorus]|uniref:Uncharacterized protein n=1 Tax=Micavibrio aeruginosavorus TaxID=349221 RepID=A0A2W5BVQ6_9BACT|nr:MAG: hypothetical protein DI626_04560 [Micavibrio aeruginosavorus]
MIDKQPLSMMGLGEVTDFGPIKFTPPPVEWGRDLGVQTAQPEEPKAAAPRKNHGMSTYWQPMAGMR